MISDLQRPAHISPEQWERALRDFETYRRELPRLLREGHAGRIAIVKNDQVVDIRDTMADALEQAESRFGPDPVATFKINPLDVDRLAQWDAETPASKESTCPS